MNSDLDRLMAMSIIMTLKVLVDRELREGGQAGECCQLAIASNKLLKAACYLLESRRMNKLGMLATFRGRTVSAREVSILDNLLIGALSCMVGDAAWEACLGTAWERLEALRSIETPEVIQ